MEQITSFQRRVYAAVSRIPRGWVSTYQRVARHINCGAPRAVGQALKANPYAPKVPCHRVIGSDLRIGGFQGETMGSAIKRKLQKLAAEGVRFEQGLLAEPARVFDFRCRKPAARDATMQEKR